MSTELTSRQHEVLAFIGHFKTLHGYPPTRADIAKHFGFKSVNAAEEHVKALVRKGAITLDRGRARGIGI